MYDKYKEIFPKNFKYNIYILSKNKTITFTGYFHELKEDDTYLFYGEAVNHPRYGFQYQVTDYERVKPEDKNGLIDFLSSDLFKGVGLKLATSIVDTLGEDAIDKILEDKSVLNLVPHITEKKINSIILEVDSVTKVIKDTKYKK